jgi:hypothetical protein
VAYRKRRRRGARQSDVGNLGGRRKIGRFDDNYRLCQAYGNEWRNVRQFWRIHGLLVAVVLGLALLSLRFVRARAAGHGVIKIHRRSRHVGRVLAHSDIRAGARGHSELHEQHADQCQQYGEQAGRRAQFQLGVTKKVENKLAAT